MKLQKIVVLHEEENRIEEIDILDGTFVFIENKEDGRIITGTSENAEVNMYILKNILK